jgi:hypothetical protein
MKQTTLRPFHASCYYVLCMFRRTYCMSVRNMQFAAEREAMILYFGGDVHVTIYSQNTCSLNLGIE